MKKQLQATAVLTAGALLFAACGSKGETLDFTVDYSNIEKGEVTAKAAVHDPSIVRDGDAYYIFGSHMSCAKSTDLIDWEMLTNGYSENNPVYTDAKNYDCGIFDFTGSATSLIPTDDKHYHVWAPDVIYNKKMGKYVMYYCSSSTFNASTLVMGTADKIDGPYEWKANLLYSGLTKDNLSATDVLDYVDEETAVATYTTKGGSEYNYEEFPNCIDPTIFYDADGRMWMVYGSWSGGIFLLEIDEETGLVIHPEADPENEVDPYFGKRLLGGGHHSIEGPYILYDEPSGYYYLYVSYGELKRDGGYQIRVFRSKTVDGPYEDMNGKKPGAEDAHNFFGLKLSGNYYMPSLSKGYKATGHNSAFIDEDGKHYIVYHTRFDGAGEEFTPKAKQYFLNAEGWPCMLPYRTSGETISENGYDDKEVVGRYFVVNQGTAIDGKVATPIVLYLQKDGSVVGDGVEGTWSATDNSYYMNITYGDKTYSGVFCAMKDEAGTDVMTFTAVGNNESVWGVKY